MNRRPFYAVPFLFAFVSLIVLQTQAQNTGRTISWYTQHAPFPMPAITAPAIPARVFSITDYGAVADGQTMNTEAIEKTIHACEAAGGGQVLVPRGLWLTGPIQLQSHIEFHLERGALLIFTRDHSQYPIIHAPGANGFVVASPVYGFDLQDVAITGEGVMDGGGDSWRPVKKGKMTEAQWKTLVASGGVLNKEEDIWWPSKEAMDGEEYLKNLRKRAKGSELKESDLLPARDFLRPYMVYLVNCRNVLLKDVSIRNSPKYVFYPHACRDLIMDHVNILNEWSAQNGDGIDISACKNVIVYECTVSVGDDGICMKSSDGGKGENAGAAALENVIVAGCTVYHAHGGFVIGSNTDGGMHNISVSDCAFVGTDIGLRFKSSMGRGGLVDAVYVRDIAMRDIATFGILFDTYYENQPAGFVHDPNAKVPTERIPEFRDFHISNIFCSGAQTAISITGLPQMPIKDIHFDTVEISAVKGLVATQARGIDLHAVKLITTQQPAMQADQTAEVRVR